MGLGRARDGKVGFAAVNAAPFAAMAMLFLVAGCSSAPDIAGVITGGAIGAASANPAVGFAVGIATDAAATAAERYYGRSRQGAEQDAIAQAAGDLPVGGSADWKIDHFIPIGNEHGQLRVTKTIDSPLAACKEVVFSVDAGSKEKPKPSWYVTQICKQADAWKWAAAEPAVARWGYLQ
jgi:hypothetical protein